MTVWLEISCMTIGGGKIPAPSAAHFSPMKRSAWNNTACSKYYSEFDAADESLDCRHPGRKPWDLVSSTRTNYQVTSGCKGEQLINMTIINGSPCHAQLHALAPSILYVWFRPRAHVACCSVTLPKKGILGFSPTLLCKTRIWSPREKIKFFIFILRRLVLVPLWEKKKRWKSKNRIHSGRCWRACIVCYYPTSI